MSLQIGQQLGSYQITSLIGKGGMGEVYRAKDTKLKRDVAIKILPDEFSRDTDRVSRFQREAESLAALNHQNIAAIYDLQQSDATRFLILEFVEGDTLADILKKRGALPVEEALQIAKQICEALEAAHEKGIIHRDLKPANIKITPDGKVKVLDFGLAKAFDAESSKANLSQSPTLSMAATNAGVILGTAAYMSPEQAKGRSVDRRTDIFAFGCVLYEMLVGRPAFSGEDVTEILAAVLMKEPAFDALPVHTPPAVRTLLLRCLRKDRQERLPDAGAARIEIQDTLIAPATADPRPETRNKRERLAWSVAAVAIVIAALGVFAYIRRPPEVTQAVRFFISPPDTWSLTQSAGLTGLAFNPLAVSPDGRLVAFVAVTADGRSLLWVRPIDTLESHPLAGTEGALRPFWSPDSRFLGFFAGRKLKKIAVSGGPSITLCDAPDGRGGAWNRDGVIIFQPQTTSELQKVSAAGGMPIPATTLAQGETTHRLPVFLPDGQHFLYQALLNGEMLGIYAASLRSTERKLLLKSSSSNVVHSQHHLLFLRDTTLMAQPFDAQRLELTGDAFPIAEQIQAQGNPPVGVFSASENGVLSYQTGPRAIYSQLAWFDRSGRQTGVLGDPGWYGDLELSPDGKHASVNILEQDRNTRDIWLYDVARGLPTRLTSDPGDESSSVWSPDGSRLAFGSGRKGLQNVYQKASSGAGAEEILLEDNVGNKWPQSWSPDSRFVLFFTGANARTLADLLVLPLSGDRKPVVFLQTEFSESRGRFSPDGKWVAYQSNESGRNEVYVAPFPGPGSKQRISTAGGTMARWSTNGAEIFYLDPDNKLMTAAVNGRGRNFEVGVVKPLFDTRAVSGIGYPYDVSADGQRFLINTLPERTAASPITVVLNWHPEPGK